MSCACQLVIKENDNDDDDDRSNDLAGRSTALAQALARPA